MVDNNKIQKYIKLAQQIKQQGPTKQVTTVPTVLSTVSVVAKTLYKSLKPLNLKNNISDNIQRAALLRI
jgi:hypothetical protein